jgi:hypothetical protein
VEDRWASGSNHFSAVKSDSSQSGAAIREWGGPFARTEPGRDRSSIRIYDPMTVADFMTKPGRIAPIGYSKGDRSFKANMARYPVVMRDLSS